MSVYSGKCDLADLFEGKDDKFIANSTFYMWEHDRRHRLDIHSRHDLIPYYPFLISSCGGNKEGMTCYLDKDSFVDSEERCFLNRDLQDILKYWRKCKRKKEDFTLDGVKKEVGLITSSTKAFAELINRVSECGENADIDGLHLPSHEWLRKEFFDFMVKEGYAEEDAYYWIYKDSWYAEDGRKERLRIG